MIDGRPETGESALHCATGRGWWVGRSVELPGCRSFRFDGTESIGTQLLHWPMEQVVKCLVFTHPDDSLELHEQQRARIRELWEATRASGHELLEIIPPTDTLAPGDQGQAVVRSVTQLYDQGIKPEWWKVGVMSEANWSALDDVVRERDPCCRRAVILDLSQPLEQLISGFSAASGPLAKGFMVGRSVWAEPAPHGSVVN